MSKTFRKLILGAKVIFNYNLCYLWYFPKIWSKKVRVGKLNKQENTPLKMIRNLTGLKMSLQTDKIQRKKLIKTFRKPDELVSDHDHEKVRVLGSKISRNEWRPLHSIAHLESHMDLHRCVYLFSVVSRDWSVLNVFLEENHSDELRGESLEASGWSCADVQIIWDCVQLLEWNGG